MPEIVTDRIRLTSLLRDWDVPYLEDAQSVIVGDGAGVPPSPKIDGYTGLYTKFDFDVAGRFLQIGAWE